MSKSGCSESTTRVVLMGEGEYEVTVASEPPVTLGELLAGLGIGARPSGQLFLNGRPADAGSIVHPGSEAAVLPRIVGG